MALLLPRRVARGVTALAASAMLAAVPARAARAQGHEEHGGNGGSAAPEQIEPRFSLHGFADVTLRNEWNDWRGGAKGPKSTSGFALGQLDLYFVSALGERITFLSESVFDTRTDGFAVSVERALLSYSWSDYLKLSIGRGHTALGYWNEAYHHGRLLQPTVDRPQVLKSETGGGMLPIHFVGVELSGAAPVAGAWHLSYVGNVANGRGVRQTVVQNAGDANIGKALALKLSLVHDGERMIRFGPSVYHDLIPADTVPATRRASIDGTTYGAHFVYQDRRVQLLAEGYGIRNAYEGGPTYTHTGWYSTFVTRLGKWNPYVGVDAVSFDTGDTFFPVSPTDLTRYLGGIRYDVNPFNAVKLEFRHDRRPQQRVNALAVQTAFTF